MSFHIRIACEMVCVFFSLVSMEINIRSAIAFGISSVQCHSERVCARAQTVKAKTDVCTTRAIGRKENTIRGWIKLSFLHINIIIHFCTPLHLLDPVHFFFSTCSFSFYGKYWTICAHFVLCISIWITEKKKTMVTNTKETHLIFPCIFSLRVARKKRQRKKYSLYTESNFSLILILNSIFIHKSHRHNSDSYLTQVVQHFTRHTLYVCVCWIFQCGIHFSGQWK